MSDQTDMEALVRQRGEAIRSAVDEVRRRLDAAEEGDDEQLAATLAEVLDEALFAVAQWEHASRWLSQRDLEREELKDMVRRSVKAWRETAGRTQTELATDMERLGFVTWKRITVAEVESGKRRLALEELIGLAMLFGITVERMVGPTAGMVVLNERQAIDRVALWALLGTDVLEANEAAATALGIGYPGDADDWRPAASIDRSTADFGGES